MSVPFKGFVVRSFYIFNLWKYYLNEHCQIIYVDIQDSGYQQLSPIYTNSASCCTLKQTFVYSISGLSFIREKCDAWSFHLILHPLVVTWKHNISHNRES